MCIKMFSIHKKIINRIAAILDFRKIAQVEKHAKNTYFEHTPWGKVKISKKAVLKLWAWSMRSQITIGPGVANQYPAKNRLWKSHFFAAPNSPSPLTWKTRGNELLGCDSVTQVAEIFTRVATRFIASFAVKKMKIGGELHPLRGERL